MGSPNRWAGLELRHLLALSAIAEHGSFNRAAAALDYTQSGISQQIAALERIVGERLIERSGGSRPVRMTEAGEVVLAHARAVLDQMTAAQADVDMLRSGTGGRLRVGAFQSVGTRLLPRLMSRLARECPAMHIELTQTTSDPELFDLLGAGRLDVTFAMPRAGGAVPGSRALHGAVRHPGGTAIRGRAPRASAIAPGAGGAALGRLASLPHHERARAPDAGTRLRAEHRSPL